MALAFAVGETISTRPSKVVAGHEPEQTNIFLQAVAKAVLGGVDSSQAVARVLGGETQKAHKDK
jgi:TRAF3-interacting protein 1